jgi:uncharacterized protein (DUF1501 family)
MAKLTRRQILSGAMVAAAAGTAAGFQGLLPAIADVTFNPSGAAERDTLVVLFLRGGADGLNVVVPYADDDYHNARPRLRLAPPTDLTQPKDNRVLKLDDYFGLHPTLMPLERLFHEGSMAVVHAVGSGDQTRSHFEAMNTMERGIATETGVASGWLARHLSSTAREVESPLRAVAIDDVMPDSLRGAMNATAMRNLARYRLYAQDIAAPGSKPFHAPQPREAAIAETLATLYGRKGEEEKRRRGDRTPNAQQLTPDAQYPTPNLVQQAGQETLAAMEAIKRLDPQNYKPAPGVVYPQDIIGDGFKQAACLIKGDVGVEVVSLDMGGWDTHVGQLPLHARFLSFLGQALGAFVTDLGKHFERTTIVVMTEFGRRVAENFSLGTDHGRASFMWILGGSGVRGGKVYARWPGLSKTKKQLEDDGDLRVTTDYRDVLAEVLTKRLGNPKIAEVFPEYVPKSHNILKPLAG